MKKFLVITCVIIVAAAANLYASPTVDPYIQAIASLTSPKASVPAAPTGCGAVRDEQTGDFHVLVPREYCGTNASGTVVSLGHTVYDGKITGYCQEF